MHCIRQGKLIIRIEKTGGEYSIPMSKEAALAFVNKESSFDRKNVMEGLLHLAAIKKWGDEYIEFHRQFMSAQAKALAHQFLKAKGIEPGTGKARTFFELALPNLEKSGFFMFPEQDLELVELSDKRVHTRIWSCPLYATWKKAGIADEDCVELCKLTCFSSLDLGKPGCENFDEAFARILNPNLQYRVLQCLPQGKKYCDIYQEIIVEE